MVSHVLRISARAVAFLLLCGPLSTSVWAAQSSLLLQSTTSTQNSGLYTHILPIFKADTGIDVRVVAVGTGQALKNAQNCDGDLVLVHAKEAEEAFVSAGYGIKRYPIMTNDFVILGPSADPKQIGTLKNLKDVLSRLAKGSTPFVSRGDDSGTHVKEQQLWAWAGIRPDPFSAWYREVGAGMGTTLNIAIGLNAYTISDRATWMTFQNKSNHRVLFASDPLLQNTYSVIAINPNHCPNVDTEQSARFIQWLLSDQGQAAIASHMVEGQPLFFPPAN